MAPELKTGLMVAVALLVIGFAVAWEVSLWQECLNTNSFWYCARVLGR